VFAGHEFCHHRDPDHDHGREKSRPLDHPHLNRLQFVDGVLRLAVSAASLQSRATQREDGHGWNVLGDRLWGHESHGREGTTHAVTQFESRALGIENGLHYRRDITLHEDAGRSMVTAFGHSMATLNNLVIGLTIGRQWTNLAKARRYYDAHPDQAIQLLFAHSRRTLWEPCEAGREDVFAQLAVQHFVAGSTEVENWTHKDRSSPSKVTDLSLAQTILTAPMETSRAALNNSNLLLM
jgi:hypothetical protein